MGGTIRWGILGTGAIAGLFAEALAALPDATLHAVASRSREGADAFARSYGVPRAYASYEELVRDPEIDVVYVATPNTAHAANAILAMESGKAVLCEKPFTLDAAEADRVIEVARRKKVFCMEGMWMRFVPIVREVAGLVRGDAIGDVRMLSAGLGLPFEHDPAHRVFDPKLGGGAMLDLGVYPLSLAFHLLGRPTSFVTQAVIGKTGVDEQASVTLTFPEERMAILTTSLRSRASNDAAIFGTDGMIRLNEPLYCPESASIVRTFKTGGGKAGGGKADAGKSKTVSSSARLKREAIARVKQLPLARDVWSRISGARPKTITRRAIGNGYAHEIIEVMRCLREGARESPIMPLDETRAIMQTIDSIRAAWGARANDGKGN